MLAKITKLNFVKMCVKIQASEIKQNLKALFKV